MTSAKRPSGRFPDRERTYMSDDRPFRRSPSSMVADSWSLFEMRQRDLPVVRTSPVASRSGLSNAEYRGATPQVGESSSGHCFCTTSTGGHHASSRHVSAGPQLTA